MNAPAPYSPEAHPTLWCRRCGRRDSEHQNGGACGAFEPGPPPAPPTPVQRVPRQLVCACGGVLAIRRDVRESQARVLVARWMRRHARCAGAAT